MRDLSSKIDNYLKYLTQKFHFSIANSSLKELETHLLITGRLSYLENSELHPVFELTDEVGRMLNSLIKTLKERQKN